MNFLSNRQRNFIDRLFQDVSENSGKLSDEDSQEASQKLEPVKSKIITLKKGNDISKADASQVIETLIELNDFIKGKLNIIHCRWKKIDGQWLVMGPEDVVVPGATVTVKSSRGEKEVEIDSIVKVGNGKAFGTPKKAEVNIPDNVSEGFWHNQDDQIIEVYKTRKGFLVAKLLDEITGEKTYLGKQGLNGLVSRLTLEEAKEFGKKTGNCIRCGKKLTKPESVERGMGDWCAGNWSA